PDRCAVVDAAADPDVVEARVWEVVAARLPEIGAAAPAAPVEPPAPVAPAPAPKQAAKGRKGRKGRKRK
ncbi:MAG TPA: hypothetical protein VM434_05110, partial [Beijerinckiaceae bacterium]|nr:hypothetical protein [Beijerinckiaceae bacterium]